MTIYAFHKGFYYEVQLDFARQRVSHVLRYRGSSEQRAEMLDFNDLDTGTQDYLIPRIRKAIRDEQDRTESETYN